MASNTYVALQTTTVTSATPSITFSSIPQGYTDLVIEATFLPSVSTSQPYIQFNTDTGTGTTNYSTTSVRGDGSSAASGRHTNIFGWYPVPGPGIGTNGNPEPWIVHIMNYSNTTTYKTGLSRFNNASSIVSANAHLWRATIQAINTITITMEAGNFNTGSTFTLYGVASASVGAKATGGTIYQDASYFYHVFSGSGTFTPTQSISADVLVIAGGGGGGYDQGGGGGAGGLLAYTSQSLTATGYTCTVGGGGASTTNGSNSSFGALTASVGGGAGGYYNGNNGSTGGSGGGGGGGNGATGIGGAATSGQGYAGGNGYGVASTFGGGGGGGSAQAGVTAVSSIPGSGGNGTSAYSSWLSVTGFGQNVSGTYYIAGGGAGGGTQAGIYNPTGYGGGGLGGNNNVGGMTNGTAAQANTGSGGGGAGAVGGATGGAGGSGLVIVRYAK